MASAFFAVDRDLIGKLQDLDGNRDNIISLDIDDLLRQEAIVLSDRIAPQDYDSPRVLPSPFIMGVLASHDHSARADDILARMRMFAPHFDAGRLCFIDPQSPGAWQGWMTESAASFIKTLVSQAGRAEREAAETSILYEKAQATLFEIEKYPVSVVAPRIVFQTLPGRSEMRIGRTPIVATLLNEFPAAHAVDLFLAKRQTVLSDADLIVQMTGALSGRELATWRVREAAIVDGWNRFYCPIAHEELGESVALAVSSSASRAQSALMATADAKPGGVDMSPANSPPFAMRVWSGYVGVKLPRLDAGHFVDADTPSVPPAEASRRELLHLASAYTREQWPDQIGWSARDTGLMVHPAGRQPTVGRIGGLQAVDLIEIKATCKLAHPEAVTTQFALWIRRAGEAVKIGAMDGEAQGQGLFRRFLGTKGAPGQANPVDEALVEAVAHATWLTLTAGQEGELSLTIDPAYTGGFDLFLATRNLDKSNSYAWAVFTDLRFKQARP